MPYTQFKNLGQVAQRFQWTVLYEKDLFGQEPLTKASQHLAEEINLTLEQGLYKASEIAIGEQLIYPVLREVWKRYIQQFLLWSHATFSVNEELTGIPDYLITQRTNFAAEVLGPPVLVTIEAKKDNFEEGWGQCAAEMMAAQTINQTPDIPVYGVVSNGKLWEFARLKNDVFIKYSNYIDIMELDRLCSVLDAILKAQVIHVSH